MPATLAEKIIARACGAERVAPGEIVTASIDLLMMHDSSGPRRVASRLADLGAKVWDPSRVVLVSDHFVPAVDSAAAEILALTRRWARDNGVRHYDSVGICHVVLQEGGHIQPGMFCVGGDSHSSSGGSFGAFMMGVGATDIAAALVTGDIWLQVPDTVRVNWSGELTAGVCAKDIMLFLCARLGMGNENRAFEFDGSTVRGMSMSERMVLCNMSAELGADTGMVSADEATLQALRDADRPFTGDIRDWQSDPDAPCAATHNFDARALDPQIAAPHSPANSQPAAAYGRIKIDQAYIGACTGAKLSDLRMAATVLQGRKVARETRLLVAPASTKATAIASADGTLEILTAAGAILLPTGCGACAGLGAGMVADGEVCISTTARNFKGRMGSPSSSVFLGSPYSVAASAVKGEICDAREMLAESL